MATNVLTVPYEAFKALLDEAIETTGGNRKQIMREVGYESATVVNAWENSNLAPTRAYMALQGLLSKLANNRPQFTFDELTALFAVLQGWPVPVDVRKTLTRTIARNL